MASSFRGRIKTILRPRLARLKARLGVDQQHSLSPDLTITLPADHRLPEYQAHHPNYDRFLPYLCSHLERGATVIDVGANCGDSLAAMYAANPTLSFLCIEPDPRFDAYLRTNIESIRRHDPHLSVEVVNAMVGKSVTGGTLAGSGGTLMRVAGNDAGFTETTLDAIMAGRGPVRLLKSDVDGFDYDVIESAEAVIALSWPILFFETLLRHDFQRQGFERTIADLAARGYRNWVVFDNFGEVMFTTRVDTEIIALLGYLWRQECGLATRTVHYFDLLACTDADRSLIDRVISGYVGE